MNPDKHLPSLDVTGILLDVILRFRAVPGYVALWLQGFLVGYSIFFCWSQLFEESIHSGIGKHTIPGCPGSPKQKLQEKHRGGVGKMYSLLQCMSLKIKHGKRSLEGEMQNMLLLLGPSAELMYTRY